MHKHLPVLMLACLCANAFCPVAMANTITCVHDSAEFQAALTAAETNGDANLIELARGTYVTSGQPFYFYATTALQLDINGGYDSDCTTIIEDPRLTVLDGGNTDTVLEIYSESAGISVRYLTLQNGSDTGLEANTLDGGIIIDFNIIRNNSSATYNGGLYVGTTGANANVVRVAGNLIVGNTTAGGGFEGAGEVRNGGAGNTYVINNTIADNINTAGGTGGLLVSSTTPGSGLLSNNIAWSNTYAGFNVEYAPILVDNDYGAIQGNIDPSSSGNVSVAPRFVGNGNYHLGANSPLLANGTLAPGGGLPTIDLEGNPRTFNNTVDLGAYERGDEIFRDGYDD